MKFATTLLSTALLAAILALVLRSPAEPAAAAPAATIGNEPYLGEIVLFAGNFAPRGWAFCDGSLLDISTNSSLYSILGTTYGGDGRTSFGLPDLRARVPVGTGRARELTPYHLGQRGGVETTTLTVAQMPAHSHELFGQTRKADAASPEGTFLAGTSDVPIYGSQANAPMHEESIGETGGNQALENRQPYLALNYIIAVRGIFPSRN